MNIEEELEACREAVKMYKYDFLTGLKGRRDFDFDLRHKFSMGIAFYVTYYDVNGLHSVNRNKGFDAGDALIRQVANDIQHQKIAHQTYRTSGDEFYAICCLEPTTDVANATMVMANSGEYQTPDEMLAQLDKLMIESKSKLKKRREDDE